jgi:geranylgeranyl pyrophosphate synthase
MKRSKNRRLKLIRHKKFGKKNEVEKLSDWLMEHGGNELAEKLHENTQNLRDKS